MTLALVRFCEVDDCTARATRRGLCDAHYHRWRRHGDPTAGGPVHRRSEGPPVLSLRPTPPDPDGRGWQASAACRGYPTEWFFPGPGQSTVAARSLCRVCPVIEECRAESRDEVHGVWAGSVRKRRA